MKVLQLGNHNWADQYTIPETLDWEFNNFPLPKKKKHNYAVVLITGQVELTAKEWEELRMSSTPYSVLFATESLSQLDKHGRLFLKQQAAIEMTESPQVTINNLEKNFYFGQTGIRVSPTNLVINRGNFPIFEFVDAYHLKIDVATDNWQNVGTYKTTPYYDPGKQLSLWLECTQDPNLETRLVVYDMEGAADQQFVLPVTSNQQEMVVPMGVTDYARFIGVTIQVRGRGTMEIGTFHYRWTRNGFGNYIAGGQKIVNSENNEEVAYYLNPGDLKPPLFVYFAGARSQEGFEAYPLFRYTGKPALLFTDPRMQMGQFYTGDYFQEKIKEVIEKTVKELGFTMQDVVTTGLSMGSYPALKLGAKLGVHAIICGKQLANLGYMAERAPRERPYGFDTGLDVASRNATDMSPEALKAIDYKFWDEFNHTDLTNTKLFIIYMLDDDYDDQAVKKLKESPAIINGIEFVPKGFPGRHNDDTATVSQLFVDRIYDMIDNDFGKEKAE